MNNDVDPEKFKLRDAGSYDTVTAQFDYYTERFTGSLAERMIELAAVSPTDLILDVGTGTGIVAFQAAHRVSEKGKVFGIDLSKEMLERAKVNIDQSKVRERIAFLQMDAENLSFGNKKFDVVVSLFALLHFPNPLKVLQEIFRVLRPGGKLVIAVGSGAPLSSPSGWLHILKKFPDFLENFRGNLLIAPQFLNEFVNKHIPRSNELEETELATRSGSRIQNVNKLVKKAGFELLGNVWQGERRIIETPEEFWEIQRTFSSVARKRLSCVTNNEFELLHEAFIEKCKTVQERGGQLMYPFGAVYVTAIRR